MVANILGKNPNQTYLLGISENRNLLTGHSNKSGNNAVKCIYLQMWTNSHWVFWRLYFDGGYHSLSPSLESEKDDFSVLEYSFWQTGTLIVEMFFTHSTGFKILLY